MSTYSVPDIVNALCVYNPISSLQQYCDAGPIVLILPMEWGKVGPERLSQAFKASELVHGRQIPPWPTTGQHFTPLLWEAWNVFSLLLRDVSEKWHLDLTWDVKSKKRC